MKIVELRLSDGAELGQVSINEDVPNASAEYGYSETSAPICANGKIVIGAAGSERGNRGFVMAYTTDLKPAWPTPFWTIPPDLQSWRRASRIVGGGPVWTPVTIDAVDQHGLLRDRFGHAGVLPVAPPGEQPAYGIDRRRQPHATAG